MDQPFVAINSMAFEDDCGICTEAGLELELISKKLTEQDETYLVDLAEDFDILGNAHPHTHAQRERERECATI